MIKKIAELAGYSTSTVRRALQDMPDISEKTRNKVKKIAGELNYKPNFLARAMVMKKTWLIGVVVPEFLSTYFTLIINKIEEIMSRHNYRILMSVHNYDNEKFYHCIETFRQYQVDGLIFNPSVFHVSEKVWSEIQSMDCPCVIINDKVGIKKIPENIFWAGSDDFKAGFEAGQYLISRGHKRILFSGYNEQSSSSFLRYQGFQEAQKEAGVSIGDHDREN